MTIEHLVIDNWESPGKTWWKLAESKPDQPLIEATMKFTLSYNEYMELLCRDKKI